MFSALSTSAAQMSGDNMRGLSLRFMRESRDSRSSIKTKKSSVDAVLSRRADHVLLRGQLGAPLRDFSSLSVLRHDGTKVMVIPGSE